MLAATSKQTNIELGRDGVPFYLSSLVICLPHTLKMIDSIEIMRYWLGLSNVLCALLDGPYSRILINMKIYLMMTSNIENVNLTKTKIKIKIKHVFVKFYASYRWNDCVGPYYVRTDKNKFITSNEIFILI